MARAKGTTAKAPGKASGSSDTPVKLGPVKPRRFLVIFSNGCKASVKADKLEVYRFQMDHPKATRTKVIEIVEEV
jgi:hypothetical protein